MYKNFRITVQVISKFVAFTPDLSIIRLVLDYFRPILVLLDKIENFETLAKYHGTKLSEMVDKCPVTAVTLKSIIFSQSL